MCVTLLRLFPIFIRAPALPSVLLTFRFLAGREDFWTVHK